MCCRDRALFPLLVVLAISPTNLPAQTNLDRLMDSPSDYVDRHFRMQDGLPSDQVRAVLQSDAGYLWVATQDGLARFDGDSFRDFTLANTPQLQNNLVSCLYQDHESRLWIGSDTGEIFWLDGAGFHVLDQNLNRHNAPISHIVEAANNVLWILDRDGLLTGITGTGAESLMATNLSGRYSDLVKDVGGRIWLVGLGSGRLTWLNGSEVVNADEPRTARRGWRNTLPPAAADCGCVTGSICAGWITVNGLRIAAAILGPPIPGAGCWKVPTARSGWARLQAVSMWWIKTAVNKS